jgi:hypothetical protein
MLRDLPVGQNRLDLAYPSSSAVIPGRAKREPGIHNHRRKVWIPDSRSAASGMTSWVTRPRTATSEQADTSSVVIPGRAKREPGIHNHRRKVWIPDSRSAASGMTSWVTHRRTTTSEQAGTSSVVIPGCAAWRRPGIHNHDRSIDSLMRNAHLRPALTGAGMKTGL